MKPPPRLRLPTEATGHNLIVDLQPLKKQRQ
jgi:hypothetical protein